MKKMKNMGKKFFEAFLFQYQLLPSESFMRSRSLPSVDGIGDLLLLYREASDGSSLLYIPESEGSMVNPDSNTKGH